jgi:hypothetical protein
VSEAASNHSGASSLDIEEDEEGEEDQQDNLSDMVSANVSGRGTPSISGRDTPSSQVTESEEAASVNQAQQRCASINIFKFSLITLYVKKTCLKDKLTNSRTIFKAHECFFVER